MGTALALVGRIRGAEFARRVALLSGGTAAGQAIALAFTPIITRLYSPAEYGVLGVYISVLGILSVAAMLRFEFAIPVAADERESRAVLRLALGVALVTSALAALVLLVADGPILRAAPSLAPMAPYLWMIPVGMLAAAGYQALSFRALRRQEIATLSRTRLTQSLGMTLTQALLGVLHAGPVGLLLGYVLGQSGGTATLWRGERVARTTPTPSPVEVRAAASRFARFPRYSAPAAMLDSMAANVPLVLFAAAFGTVVVGWLSLVQRVLLVPLNLVGASTTQVVFAELSRAHREDPASLPALFARRLRQIGLLAVSLTAAVVVGGTTLVPFLFGREWAPAGWCVAALAPAALLGFVAQPFGAVLDVLQRQDLHLLREIVKATVMGVAIAVALRLGLEWRDAVLVYGGALAVNAGWALAVARYALRNPGPSAPGVGAT
jgi:O-antigen/teichoic acid export membrane protein